VLIIEFGAVPISAGRTSGSAGVGDGVGDAFFSVCDDATPASSNKPTKQKIPSRMAK